MHHECENKPPYIGVQQDLYYVLNGYQMSHAFKITIKIVLVFYFLFSYS